MRLDYCLLCGQFTLSCRSASDAPPTPYPLRRGEGGRFRVHRLGVRQYGRCENCYLLRFRTCLTCVAPCTFAPVSAIDSPRSRYRNEVFYVSIIYTWWCRLNYVSNKIYTCRSLRKHYSIITITIIKHRTKHTVGTKHWNVAYVLTQIVFVMRIIEFFANNTRLSPLRNVYLYIGLKSIYYEYVCAIIYEAQKFLDISKETPDQSTICCIFLCLYLLIIYWTTKNQFKIKSYLLFATTGMSAYKIITVRFFKTK